ncbi:LAME_0C03488g1_1 [Lachancea meyersii CBS 8951]|uniref:LAME_0C03488g1_1 n=1 Tax=Lachancea meyersii CBS 8951 TaxID=1266667 RepID=A0A1G4J084_9SACH|nr:LAME_0C03488g1_1 [Lachancea meyersii CBS 8951]
MVVPAFGHEFKSKYFTLLDPNVTLINHGSYGTTPTCVIEKQMEQCKAAELYPDEYLNETAEENYKHQVKVLAEYLKIDWRNLALVVNATVGINTVLRSIKWDFSKDKVLFHSTSYGACGNTVKFLAEYYHLQYDVVEIEYPVEDDQLLAAFEEKLSTGEYRLCMFDMISSQPGVMLPHENLIKLCQKYSTMSLVDGAHAAGQVDLQFLDELHPDFLTTNLHKWLSVPKSCALLYVNPKHHATIQTTPVSWNYTAEGCQAIKDPKTAEEIEHNDHLMHNKFWFSGTVSYAAYFCVEEAIAFRKNICGGEEKIREYQWQVQKAAIEAITGVFGPGSKLMQNSTGTLTTPGLFNVSLPLDAKYSSIQQKLSTDFNFFRRFKAQCDVVARSKKAYAPFYFHGGDAWVRFSAQIFNEVQDYVVAAEIIKAIIMERLDEQLQLQK